MLFQPALITFKSVKVADEGPLLDDLDGYLGIDRNLPPTLKA
jgi:hypothetical protein